MKKVVSILIFLAIVLISIYSNAMTIVLDPGHGGTDSGAIENGIYEKDVNLKIANYLKEYLQQYNNVDLGQVFRHIFPRIFIDLSRFA